MLITWSDVKVTGSWSNDSHSANPQNPGTGSHILIVQHALDWFPTDWVHYHNYTEIVNILFYLNFSYPTIVDVFSIGKSWLDRDIYCIRLTNENNTNFKSKLLFVGYHHAREPISAELPLYFVIDVVTNYSGNETIRRMLDFCEIFIVVALNVDAFEAFEQNEWQRKNLHALDEDGDSLLDEDQPDDEDGDGSIELLWEWNGSDWVFVQSEGLDDDGDGLFNEDWVGGVDLNRNYGYQWDAQSQSGSTDPFEEDYRGSAPFSEPETQAMRELALSHDFKYAISFHSGAEVILYPWGYTSVPTPHDSLFKDVAGNISRFVGAPFAQSGGGLYTSSGLWDDWMYGNRSTYALTCEIYTDEDAWQHEPGPYQDSWWEKGVSQFFNPDPNNMETVIRRWLPAFAYVIERAIIENFDVTGDDYVGIDDIVETAEHFGAQPGDIKWVPIFDINRDHYVGIDDIVAVAEHFGEAVP